MIEWSKQEKRTKGIDPDGWVSRRMGGKRIESESGDSDGADCWCSFSRVNKWAKRMKRVGSVDWVSRSKRMKRMVRMQRLIEGARKEDAKDWLSRLDQK